jgi:transposase
MQSLVYVDESGFESKDSYRTHGWSSRGQLIYGDRSGSRQRTNLVAGKVGKKLLAPFLFNGSMDAACFNFWLKEMLLPSLPPNSLIILDNAAFHKTEETQTIINQTSHQVMYLPPYSPDFNPIEEDFAIIKKRLKFSNPQCSIDHIVKMYNSYLE